MPSPHVLPALCIRALATATVALQLGGAAAIADAHLDVSPTNTASDTPAASTPLTVVVASDATPVVARIDEVTTTTTEPAPALDPPVPATAPPPPPPLPAPVDPAARAQAALSRSVPAPWRQAIAVRLEIIDGASSWAHHDGTIEIGMAHARGSDALLRATVAHEFGHLIAFRYGSQAFNGAAPEGWPTYGSQPAEAWADCVSLSFTGVDDPSHGLPSCAGNALSWTTRWLQAGPRAHPPTG